MKTTSITPNTYPKTPKMMPLEKKREKEKINQIYCSPLLSLMERAHAVFKSHFHPGEIQTSQLLSIKTGACPEDCAYCPQSARYQTGVQRESLMSLEAVVKKAQEAKQNGATRFCMGAAWREVREGPAFDRVLQMVREVSALGLQTCCTLGMVSKKQAVALKEAGLYAYNHNIDTSENFYKKIIHTRRYEDRLRTIENVRAAGITVCTGGILGMGESDQDRVDFIHQLASFDPQPESVTINQLVAIKGTPLEHQKPLDPLILLRVIATCRILMPSSMIRLSAGRMSLSKVEQLTAYYVGANSIFLGEKLLTSPNPEVVKDRQLFSDLGLKVMKVTETTEAVKS